ncbi:MAG: hypothetical protein ACRC8J_01585 [Phocaeicola sp.]
MKRSKKTKHIIRKGSVGGYMLTDEQLTKMIDKSTVTTLDKEQAVKGTNNDSKDDKESR